MCDPVSIGVAALGAGSSYASSRSQRKAQRRAERAANQQNQEARATARQNAILSDQSGRANAQRQADAAAQAANQQASANRLSASLQSQALEKQREGNEKAAGLVSQVTESVAGDNAQENIRTLQGGANSQTTPLLQIAENQGRRATGSDVQGSISDSFSRAASDNKDSLNADTNRLTNIFSGINAIRQNQVNDGVSINNASAALTRTLNDSNYDSRLLQNQAQAAQNSALGYQPPFQSSPYLSQYIPQDVNIQANTTLADILGLAGSFLSAGGLGAFGGTGPTGGGPQL